ncbi:MAG: hypothetical protein ACP5VN_10780 [Acidobacteriota bacterium]
MPGARSLLATLALLGLGCAPRLPTPSLPGGTAPPAGKGRITLLAGRSGLSAPCAFALDATLGKARVEIREPMGATRLVLFLEPGAALLWDPAGGGWTRWEKAGPGLPFAPGDLWAALLLRPPGGARGRAWGPELRASWRNGAGRVRGNFCEDGRERRVSLQGPRGARLEIRFEAVEAATPPEGAFTPPPLPEEGRTTLPVLLGEREP